MNVCRKCASIHYMILNNLEMFVFYWTRVKVVVDDHFGTCLESCWTPRSRIGIRKCCCCCIIWKYTPDLLSHILTFTGKEVANVSCFSFCFFSVSTLCLIKSGTKAIFSLCGPGHRSSHFSNLLVSAEIIIAPLWCYCSLHFIHETLA